MTPKLRFSQTVYPAPQSLTVGDLFSFVKEKNKDGKVSNVITNSAEYGLIPQRDFFDKDIAVEGNTSNYTIIHEGDFVYNPRKSASAPYGPFNCYGLPEEGIVSPLYTCLTPKDKEYTPYLLWYFRSSAWHLYIMLNGAQGGARHDRVGMTNQLMKDIPVYLPCKEERDAIADFLTAYDEKVSLQQQKVEALERRKKGLLQKVFSQKIRFKADDGSDFPEWEEKKFGDTVKIERGGSPRPIEQFITDSEGYNWIKIGDAPEYGNHITRTAQKIKASGLKKTRQVFKGDLILSNSMSFGKPYIMDIDGCIHDGWLVIRDEGENYNLTYLCFLLGSEFMLQQYKSLAAGTGVNNLNKELVGGTTVLYPCLTEQQKIADFFSVIDEQIEIEKKRLESMQTIKKGLLQQMFCDGSEE